MINILVVDDEPISADGISIYLQERGETDWTVRTAYNGIQALEIARQRVDILVSDIRMPGLDGFQVQEKIREIWPMSRCVFLTSVQQMDYVQRAIRSGTAVDYVLKIEGEEVILDAVRKAADVQKNEIHTRELLQRAEEEIREVRPLLQKELILSLLRGTHLPFSLAERFRELEFFFRADQRVLLILGQVGDEPSSGGTPDISAFVLNNILEKLLSFCKTCPLLTKEMPDMFFPCWKRFRKLSAGPEERLHLRWMMTNASGMSCRRIITL